MPEVLPPGVLANLLVLRGLAADSGSGRQQSEVRTQADPNISTIHMQVRTQADPNIQKFHAQRLALATHLASNTSPGKHLIIEVVFAVPLCQT